MSAASAAFQQHETLAADAHAALTAAVTHDEHARHAQALAAYLAAITHLSAYVRAFTPLAPTFLSLSRAEKPAVRATHDKLLAHLRSARRRRDALVADGVVSAASVPVKKQPRQPQLPPNASPRRAPDPFRSVPAAAPRAFPHAATRSFPSLASPGRAGRVGPAATGGTAARAVAGPGAGGGAGAAVATGGGAGSGGGGAQVDDALRRAIESDILSDAASVSWDDVYGLTDVKEALHEMVVLPALRPDLYTGLRAPGRGILLFGPPGTGKTLIARAVASNARATFFSISAASLLSKFHGESERLVRALFAIARERAPAFIFFDEVDSILGARGDGEHEASRRLKTEFMAQFDGAAGPDCAVYVMAASNRPQDLDDAVRRRLDRRIYVPLPDQAGRLLFLRRTLAAHDAVRWDVSDPQLAAVARRMARFSGSDIKAACREAALMPLRELGTRVGDVRADEVRACTAADFDAALDIVRASSNAAQVRELETWNDKFGSTGAGGGAKGGRKSGGVGAGGGGGAAGGARINGTAGSANGGAGTGSGAGSAVVVRETKRLPDGAHARAARPRGRASARREDGGGSREVWKQLFSSRPRGGDDGGGSGR